MQRKHVLAVVAATAGVLAVPALASGHATVSSTQPQGKALTSARTSYVLRVPNERPTVGTRRVVLLIPEGVQEVISFRKVPGWRIKLTRVDTGKKNDEGEAIHKTTRASFTAIGAASVIDPGFYEEFPFRFQNPAAPAKLCFGAAQFYEKARGERKGEVVMWTGAAESETPASCVDVVAS